MFEASDQTIQTWPHKLYQHYLISTVLGIVNILSCITISDVIVHVLTYY